LKISFVEEKFVGPHIGRKENIRQSVVIDISGGYTCPIIEVPVTENVEVTGIGNGIAEFNPAVVDLGEKCFGCFFFRARYYYRYYRNNGDEFVHMVVKQKGQFTLTFLYDKVKNICYW
jgi:hypothetical protein